MVTVYHCCRNLCLAESEAQWGDSESSFHEAEKIEAGCGVVGCFFYSLLPLGPATQFTIKFHTWKLIFFLINTWLWFVSRQVVFNLIVLSTFPPGLYLYSFLYFLLHGLLCSWIKGSYCSLFMLPLLYSSQIFPCISSLSLQPCLFFLVLQLVIQFFFRPTRYFK